MDSESPTRPDGGSRTGEAKLQVGTAASHPESDEVDTTGAGAFGGAVAGGIAGVIFGPTGAVGGAVLGAILGDEYEMRTLRRGLQTVGRTRDSPNDET